MSSLSSFYHNSSSAGRMPYSGFSSLSAAVEGLGSGGYGGNPAPFSSPPSYFASEPPRHHPSDPSSRAFPPPDPLSLHGPSSSFLSNMLTSQSFPLSSWNPSPPPSSWHQGPQQPPDPVLSGFKRPADDVFYNGDIMSKRARVDSTPSLPVYPQRPGEKDCAFYMRTRTCSFGASCKYDHPAWVPAGGIPDWKEASAATSKSESLPVRSGELDCAFYMKTGICKYGTKCKFNHPKDRSTSGLDKKLLEEGAHESVEGTLKTSAIATAANGTPAKVTALAANGDDGDSKAPPKPATAFTAKGLPIRPGESDCSFYMKTGSCKYGSTCRFNHPEKKPATGSAQSQTFVPSLLGSLSGGLGHASAFSGAISDYGLNISGTGFGLSSLAPISLYPQRPGEAACPYYVKTGICKFASSCKFHHPVNRTDPSYSEPNVKLTLAGLPRREGEQSCPYYMKTGSCKFGTTCKYDHPPPGEAAAKALADASRSEQNQLSDSDPNS